MLNMQEFIIFFVLLAFLRHSKFVSQTSSDPGAIMKGRIMKIPI